MRLLRLGNGANAVVDDDVFDLIARHKWQYQRNASGSEYAFAKIEGRKVYLHRFIMPVGSTDIVDHRDGNGLNNLRENLRVCSRSQNNQNSRPKRQRAGHKKGAYRCHAARGGRLPWYSQIVVNGRRIHLGYFATQDDAAAAYGGAAKQFFGEFAHN